MISARPARQPRGLFQRLDRRQISGWLAVLISAAVTSLWAFWGIIENFHEGWYFESLWANLGLMVVQYLSPMLLFLLVTLAAIRWPRLGAGLYVLLALLAIWFFGGFSNAALLLMILPFVGLGALFWVGRPQPRKWAVLLVIGLPLATLILAGAVPAVRVSQRLDDGFLGARRVQANGVDLLWAPEGPGWPVAGMDWHVARQTCQHLDAEGLALDTAPQDHWRLPTVAEAVRSMARHGVNSQGTWEPSDATASYETTPDKESPLWNVHSQVIYWWTATEAEEEQAYIIVYDGEVWPRSKDFGPAYLGFRCVREP